LRIRRETISAKVERSMPVRSTTLVWFKPSFSEAAIRIASWRGVMKLRAFAAKSSQRPVLLGAADAWASGSAVA
jgi:hypothetical protein